MIKIITYGTFDLLHYGHIRLLERAKSLGDYLIVGVTSDDYDKTRGKLNVQQSLNERLEAVKKLRIADEVIVEEYEGQKIDDILKYEVDIFTVGSDWRGLFDYLNEYCKVVYLERTEGVSSSDIRTQNNHVNFGIVGESLALDKFDRECEFVNGANVTAIFSKYPSFLPYSLKLDKHILDSYDDLLEEVDAVYISSCPSSHYEYVKKALMKGKHVLCESPITINAEQTKELYHYAGANDLILFEGNKTAYCTAYSRLLLLLKSGKIGDIYSVDTTCTSLNEAYYNKGISNFERWNSIESWGAKCLLPIFQILGCDYKEKFIYSNITDEERLFDSFTKIDFHYSHAVASMKVGKGVKSEGEMIVSGTNGYLFVPAPWWKTDYFEIRYENSVDNRRYFYQLEGEGIRYEIVKFIKSIESGRKFDSVSQDISVAISKIMEEFYARKYISI